MRLVVEPRERVGTVFKALVLAGSLLAGFFAVGLLFLAAGANPIFALGRIFAGSFGSVFGIREVVTKAIPLILAGGGLAVAFRGRFWNIGAESQLLVGAMAATWVGLGLGPGAPAPLGVALMFVAGFGAGALWGMVPAVLKVRFGTNEVISTLMLNYIAAELLNSLIVGPWKGATQLGFPYTDDLPRQLHLALLPGSRIHVLTLVVALGAAVLLAFLLYRTKFGYEVRVVGENPEAARYAGIDLFRTTVLVMVISGGLAGLAGVGEVAGIHHRLGYPRSVSAGYGFTAIIVAWLGKLNPLAIVGSALFFSGILVGGDAIQISLGLPAATVDVFNGVLLVFLIAGDYFLENRVVIVSVAAAKAGRA